MIRINLRENNEMQFPKRIRLMQFNGSAGIVRCAHHDQQRVIDGLNHLDSAKGETGSVSTQGCSGTIRALRKKYHIEKEQKRKE
jgi:RNase P/RNase MRP subunit POP5